MSKHTKEPSIYVHDELGDVIGVTLACYEALCDETAAHIAALDKFVVHENGCTKFMSLDRIECTCGLDDARKAAGVL